MRDEESLAAACRDIGADVLLTQGPGGNISIKDDRIMHIKASGTTLAVVTADRGQLPVAYQEVRAYLRSLPDDIVWSPELEREYLRSLRDARLSDAAMPSLETGFHAAMGPAIVHTHPMALNALLCSREGYRMLDRLPTLSYATVGAVLSRRLLPYAEEPVVLLRNHGLITQGSTLDGAVERTRIIVEEAEGILSRAGAPLPEPMRDGRSFAVERLAREDRLDGLSTHVFPDSVVYCSYGPGGSVRLFADGTIDAPNENVAQIAHAHAYLILATAYFGGPLPLPQREIDILRGMESEKYRQKQQGGGA